MPRSRTKVCDVFVARVIAGLAICAAANACGGGSSGEPGPDGKVHQGVGVSGSMSVSPTTLTIVQGQSASATLSLALKGSAPGPITFHVSSLPTGITASFNPPTASGSGSSTVTFTAATDAPILSGLQPYFVGFVGADTLILDGQAPSVTITVRNGRPGVNIQKAGTGAGTVTSSPAGINCGNASVSCSGVFDLGPITLTATPATGSAFTSWAGTCTGTAPTCTFTPNDFGNVITATFTSIAPAISVAASPSPLTVQPGATASTTVTVTRINGYADPVNLTFSAPTGITVSSNPTSITGMTSTLTIGAAASLAAGNYPVTITASGTGVTQQSITLPVQVPLATNGGSITFNYTNCETSQTPIWFAVQNGTGPWTRVTGSNNTFTFTLGATGGYAIVLRDGTDVRTSVLYASAAEIAAIAVANPCGTDPASGTKHLFGLFANAGTVRQGVLATIVVGGAQFTRESDSTTSFALTNVPRGPRDLIAVRINSAANASAMIVRRNTNYTNNQNLGQIDFGTAEAFNPPLGALTPLNLGGDQVGVSAALLTANGLSETYYSSNFLGPAGNTAYVGLPDSQLLPGDFHSVLIGAIPPSGNAFRLIGMLSHSVMSTAPLQVTFGPRVSGAAVSSLPAAAYLRLRGQVASQSAYTAGASADFSQDGTRVSVTKTTAYLGSAPTTWVLDIPDLTAAGYDPTWGLKNGKGASWEVDALGGNLLPFLGGQPVDNAQFILAGSSDSSAVFSASRRLRIPRPPRR